MKQLLITTIAAVVLVGCGESQQLTPSVESPNAKSQLPAGVDVKKKDKDGETFLHSAAVGGSKEIIELAIANGADVNATNNWGWTPLHNAIHAGNGSRAYLSKEIAETLIANGADVNAMNDDGETPLDWNVAETSPQGSQNTIGDELSALLRKHGGKSGYWLRAEGSINIAAGAGHIEAVKKHLADGADVNTKDSDGMTPLHSAAYGGHKEIAGLLIAKGADVNAANNVKLTPLDLASDEVVGLLLKQGGKRGSILGAAKVGDLENVKELLDAGADVNAKPELGSPPLHVVAINGHKEIAELLITGGADVNSKSELGQTPLHQAAQFGRKEIAELLIAKGADVNAKDSFAETPLDYAKTEIADLLRKHGGKTGEELKAEEK